MAPIFFLNKQKTQIMTLSQVNKAIQKKRPKLFLAKGDGYFYLTSDYDEVFQMLCQYPSGMSIYVNNINDLSLERWIAEVDQLFKF